MVDTMHQYLGLLISTLSLYSTCSQSYTPDGYIGCFRDFQYRILDGDRRISNTNSGDECIRFCRSNGYRYAGTEFRNECYCGYQIQLKIPTKACTFTCAGNKNEICGGDWSISVYDIKRTYTVILLHAFRWFIEIYQ
ncbi:xylosyltransferase oxt-like [Ruditapes philippinarum]|uniref:xylosyltransferase oxt-like n=1 Tax=Ruditapes philippinarum TaxID=129788 RepID=UPI00295C2D8E|nr:xylosyltransferase oxt-like [Ruditapes philippinarum]